MEDETYLKSSVVFGLITVILLLWRAYWRITRRHMIELAEKIPGPKGLPLLGSMLEFTGNPHGTKNCSWVHKSGSLKYF